MKINNPGIGASGRGELVIVIAVKVGFYTPKIHKADAPPQLTVRFSPDMSIAEMQMVINATIHNIGVIYQFEGGQYSEDTSVYFNGGTNMSIIVQDKQRVRNQWLYGMDKTDAEMGDIPGWTKGCSQFVPPVVHPDIMAMINYVEGRDDNGSTISDFAKGVPSKKRTYRRYEPLPRVTVPFTEGVPYEWPKIEYTDVTVDELIGGGQSLEDWLGKQIASGARTAGRPCRSGGKSSGISSHALS